MGIDALKPTEVFAVYETLLHGGNVRLAGENDTLDFNYRAVLDALGRKVSPASIMDAYLVAFATTSNAIIVTMDRGLARLADSQGVRSFLIRARTV
jgi:predicted nucleic acid-binding protein